MDLFVKKLRDGDERAFAELYKSAYHRCASIIFKNGGDENDAMDVFSRAMEIFWNKITMPDFELSCSPNTYLYAVVRNLWLKRLRKTKKDLLLKDVDFEKEIEPFIADEEIFFLEDGDADDLLMLCLKVLEDFNNEDCKKVLRLYYFEKKSHKEIADILGIVENYSKVKKSNCLGYLKKNVLKELENTKKK